MGDCNGSAGLSVVRTGITEGRTAGNEDATRSGLRFHVNIEETIMNKGRQSWNVERAIFMKWRFI